MRFVTPLFAACLALGAAPGLAQPVPDQLPFQTIKDLTGEKVLSHLGRLGFRCEPAEEAPSKSEEAFRCGNGQGPGQHYTAWLVAYPKGLFLSLTVSVQRAAGGGLDIAAATRMLRAVTALEYADSEPVEVENWMYRNLEEPLQRDRPELNEVNPRTGRPFEAEPLQVGSMIFRVVGFPGSPGIDLSVQGY